ncbi:MAG: hypothetical protein U5K56_05015 [Halioglobus sp.]|nr:hypothetical protein [Halioglobus sp.]
MHNPVWNLHCRGLGHYFTGLLISLLFSSMVHAETTTLAIHARADDAKFIGSGTGGMNVIIEDAATGELLDSGRITGGTGDTESLMTTGQTRGRSPTAGAAGYRASLDIDAPTRVRIQVTGPLVEGDSIQTLSATTWVIPGRDMVDPGIVLYMPGLLVQLVSVDQQSDQLNVEADVSMMCGCPITEGGLWDAAGFQVMGELYREGERIARAPLAFTGKTNRFSGQLEASEPGEFELVVHAFQDNRDNAGVNRQSIVMQ